MRVAKRTEPHVWVTRRDFMLGAGAMAGWGLAGCRSLDAKCLSRCRCATYWCTWTAQAATRASNIETGELKFPGDQGIPGTRDNLNEDIVFGPKGWINLFPEYRGDMLFLLDDGWDVPYGAKSGAMPLFSSLVPDKVRFPSPGANASGRERLRELARRVEGSGWRGLGVWVACQAHGEDYGHPFGMEALKEDLRRKLDDAAFAGVRYWKVDWGVHDHHVWYRRLMSEMKEQYYPELIIDHCQGTSNALNGQADPRRNQDGLPKYVGRTGRIFGVPEYEPITRAYEEIMTFADVFRTYDSAHPLTTATMLERAAWELHAADKSSSRVVVNTEDEPLIAAGLGVELSMMRSPLVSKAKVSRVRPRHLRMAEDMRCIVWQRVATPFGSDTPAKTLHSEKSIREEWNFVPGESWFTRGKEASYYQVAPACVTRGLALPEVKGADGEVPYVVGSRNPNGVLTFAAMPLLDPVKMSYTPKAEVRFDAALEPDASVGVFGRFGKLVLDDRTGGRRIFARDILGGDSIDITAQCVREAGRVALPGNVLAEIGASKNPSGDDSEPGAVIEVG